MGGRGEAAFRPGCFTTAYACLLRVEFKIVHAQENVDQPTGLCLGPAGEGACWLFLSVFLFLLLEVSLGKEVLPIRGLAGNQIQQDVTNEEVLRKVVMVFNDR